MIASPAILLPLAAALTVSFAACGALRHLAPRLRLLSPITQQRVGPGRIPILGGAGVLLGLGAGWAVALLWHPAGPDPPGAGGDPPGFVAPALVLAFALIGGIDDRRRLPVTARLIAELGLALAVLMWGSAGAPDRGRFLPLVLLPACCVVVGANAFNMSDNADGLAGGTGLLCFLALALVHGPAQPDGRLAVAAAGALGGFLLWNRPPARIYLGDHGSLALGALLALRLVAIDREPGGGLAVLLLAGYLLFDPGYAVVDRLRRGVPPWRGGVDHPSHDLAARFGSWPRAWAVVLLIHILSAAAGYGLLASRLPRAAGPIALCLWAALLVAALSGRRLRRARGETL